MSGALKAVSNPGDGFFLARHAGVIVVPDDYDHDTFLDRFRAERERGFEFYANEISSGNFRSTDRLVPGQRLVVELHGHVMNVEGDECLAFLRAQDSLLLGAHGAALFCSLLPQQLKKGVRHAFFDVPDALWVPIEGIPHRVPVLETGHHGGDSFELGYYEGTWPKNGSLVVFRG